MPHLGVALCSGTCLPSDWNDLVRSRAGSHITAQAPSHQAALCLLGPTCLHLWTLLTPTLHVRATINRGTSLERYKWLHVPSAMSHPMHKLEVSELFMVLQKTDWEGRHDVWECCWLIRMQEGKREQQHLWVMFLLGCEAVRSGAAELFLLL